MKTAFVTGGGRGIGRGFTEYLLASNFQVIIGVRNLQNVSDDLKKRKKLFIVPLDVSDDVSIKKAYDMTCQYVDHLDYLVNNAGLNKDTATDNHKELVCNLKDLDRKSLLKMFDVNAVSPIMVVKSFIPLLKNDPAYIINITSGRASYKDEYPNQTGNYGYRASKAALNFMTFASTWDIPRFVRTFAVHPGGVKTDMNPTGEHNAIEQAEKIITITKNWKAEFNGKFLRFDGTLYPL